MSSIDLVIPVQEFSQTEVDMIVEIFSNPLVKKYLRTMGQNDLKELASLSVTERDNSEVAKKHAYVQGKLSTLATLISIIKPENKS